MFVQYVMFARVLRLRQMGVLLRGPRSPEDQWPRGIFETSDCGFGRPPTVRRLVLRDSMSSPDMGLLMELYQPMLVQAKAPHLRFRGIEAVRLAGDEIGGMVQEWLVRFID